MTSADVPAFSALRSDTDADVCVVGAGIAGLTTAYLLCREGRSVVVIDDGPIVSGESERTTAHIANALDDRYFELARLHGAEGARLAAESHTAAIDQIERIVAFERIPCAFERVDGYLFLAPGQPGRLLEDELKAAHEAGLVDTKVVSRAPLATFDTGPALHFPRQAQFHPVRYLASVAHAIERKGGRIYTHTHATQVKGGRNARVETRDGPVITARAVVVATNTPINDTFAIHTKQAAYRTYVIAAPVPAGTVPKVLYWDAADPYHYVRLDSSAAAGQDVLIVGGEDHKTGQADDAEARYERLEKWARERFPMMGELRWRWSGQVMEPVDSLGYIGENPLDRDNVYIATGDSGNGITHGTIAGMLITDLIAGRENPWAKLYDPSRKTLRAAGEYTREATNMAAQYTDWLRAGDVKQDTDVAPGTGAIVRRGLAKIAVYRDERGELHECSATCPHLGGIVCWNHLEKTWDCPVHGSRFDPYGKVLNGPANKNLEHVDTPASRR
jgi:glycine/D-amino acid oxidase-like deaminating enzyme/nitrite reductase/ring-hydroxylating ferredoxin subunit